MKNHFKLLLVVFLMAVITLSFASCDKISDLFGKDDVVDEPTENVWNINTVYEQAKTLGYEGSLEEFLTLVSGKDGANGKDGINGTSITSSFIDEKGHLILVLSNETTIDAGKLPSAESSGVFKVTFDLGNGQKTEAYSKNFRIEKPEDPVRENYEFVCWYLEIEELEDETPWIFDAYAVTSDITLHAKWIEVSNVSKGLEYTLSGDKTYYSVTGIGTCTDTEIVIPAKYNDLPVKAISYKAFEHEYHVISIAIPESVTSIGDYAFYYCTNLMSVTIHEGVTTIGDYAFSRCRNLASFIIPESVTSIGDYAFYYCTSLMSVTIHEGVTAIGDYAFSDCTSLMSVTIPEGVTAIGDYAFSCCRNLTSFIIPESVTSIGNCAFLDCSSITSINIPKNVTSIGAYALNSCTALEEIYFNATELNEFAGWIFANAGKAKNGTKVVIGKNVTKIPSWLFHMTPKITSVEFENGSVCKSIEHSAFNGCANLTSITIPESVTSIANNAFYGCEKLIEVYNLSNSSILDDFDSDNYLAYYALDIYTNLDAKSKQWITEDGFIFYEDEDICYLLGYKGNESELTLPTSCNDKSYEIYKYAFYHNSIIKKVVIPENVTSIGDNAFSGCTNLTSVTFDNSEGWYVRHASNPDSTISSADLVNHAKAAEFLTDTYFDCFWYRKYLI